MSFRRALALCCFLLVPVPALAETPEPGLWSVLATLRFHDGTTQSYQQNRCLTPEMIADPDDAFQQAALPLPDCTRRADWDGQALTFNLRCSSQGTRVTSSGRITFPTPQSGAGKVETRGAIGTQPLDFTMTLTGQRVGECE